MNSIQNLIELTGVDPERVRRNEAIQYAALDGQGDYIPILCAAELTERQAKALPFNANHAQEWHSHELTLLNGLHWTARIVNSGCDAAPSIRPNMGCGLAATMFGAEQTVFEDKTPWVTRHVPLESLDNFDADAAPLTDVVQLGLERTKFLAEALAGSGITTYCYDCQGPFDLAHLVIGDGLFLALYDEPQRVGRLLDNCARVIIRLVGLYKQACGEPRAGGRYSKCQVMRGGVLLCEDTSTLLNPEQIARFVVPYTRKVLSAFGGGRVHFCGNNRHLYKAVMEDMPEALSFNLGNPERYDMEKVLADCIQRGKTCIQFLPRPQGQDLESYFRQTLRLTRGAGRGMLFDWPVFRPGEDVPSAVELWRRLQDKRA